MNYTLRFHLGKGRNYKKWQLKRMSPVGKFALTTNYYEPENFHAILYNCKLRNQEATAKKIHEGMNKTVCAWVQFEDIHLLGDSVPHSLMSLLGESYRYNPRKQPNWVSDTSDNADGVELPLVLVTNRMLYAITPEV